MRCSWCCWRGACGVHYEGTVAGTGSRVHVDIDDWSACNTHWSRVDGGSLAIILHILVVNGVSVDLMAMDDGRVGGIIVGIRNNVVLERSAVGIEVFSKTGNTRPGEDAEDFALMVVKLRRGLAAEDGEVLAKECLNTCQTEMRQARTVVQECVDALKSVSHISTSEISTACKRNSYVKRQ